MFLLQLWAVVSLVISLEFLDGVLGGEGGGGGGGGGENILIVKLAESAAERAVLAILRKFQASRAGGLRQPPRPVVPNRQFRGRSPDALTSEVLVQPPDVNMDDEIKSEGGRGRRERGGGKF